MLVLTLNNEGRDREVPRLSSVPTNSLDGLALVPAAVLLRDDPPWRSAFPRAGRDAACAGFEAWIPPMPKGEPGTTTKDASIVAMRMGDGRWSARDRCSVVVSTLLVRRRSVLAAAMAEVDGIGKEWK